MKKIVSITLAMLFCHAFAFADTEVSGLITEDTTWTVENSPYVLMDNVGVDDGVILTIGPGVMVTVNSNDNYPLIIMGKIIAQGTTSEPIIFTAERQYNWSAIELRYSRDSVFEWCEFSELKSGIDGHVYGTTVKNCKFSNIGYRAIRFYGDCLIQDNYFTQCCRSDSGVSVLYAIGDNNIIRGNIIEDNPCSGGIDAGDNSIIEGNIIKCNTEDYCGGMMGIRVSCDSPSIISGNTIIANNHIGIIVDCYVFSSREWRYNWSGTISDNIIYGNWAGIQVCGGDITHNLIVGNNIGIYPCIKSSIHYNNIYNNSEYNIKTMDTLEPHTDIDATNNWWGTTDESEIQEYIYDYNDNWGVDTIVDYIPWLTEPDPNAPTFSTTTSTTSIISTTTTTIFPLSTTTTLQLTTSTTTLQPAPDTLSISGHVTGDLISNISIVLSGAASKTTNTDVVHGYYEFSDLDSGYYTITPEMEGYSFEPLNHVIQNLSSDLDGLDFVSTRIKPVSPCALELIYGEDSEETENIRYIRDNVLIKTPEGRELIKLYYQWSPAIVRAMEKDKEFKEDVKEVIDGVLGLVTE